MKENIKKIILNFAVLLMGSLIFFMISPYVSMLYNTHLVTDFKFEKHKVSDVCKPLCREKFDLAIKGIIKQGTSKSEAENILVRQGGARINDHGDGRVIYSYETFTGIFTTANWMVVVYYNEDNLVESIQTNVGLTSF